MHYGPSPLLHNNYKEDWKTKRYHFQRISIIIPHYGFKYLIMIKKVLNIFENEIFQKTSN